VTAEPFVRLDLPVDERDAIDELIAAFTARFPGIQLAEGHPVEALLEVVGFADAQNARTGQVIWAAATDAFGRKIVGIDRIDGAPAQMQSTWTVRDTAGYTIPAGQVVAIYPVTGTDLAVFRPATDIIVDPGQTTATDVTLVADEIGTNRNGLPAGPLRLGVNDARIFSVVSTSTSIGGVDPETDRVWLNRLADEFQMPLRNPVLAEGFATAARRIPEVHRARVLGRFNGATSTPNTPGHVTVVAVNADGQPISPAAVDVLAEELGGTDNHIAGFTLHLPEPSYNDVTVDFTGIAADGFLPADVREAGIAVLNDRLATGRFAGGGTLAPRWDPIDTIAINDLIGALYSIPGMLRVLTVTINGDADDFTMIGVAPLPVPIAITGTVT
jgi:hypothetical protein